MIIQTAPSGAPRLAVMMHEHTALSGQFARAFGNDRFESVCPNDLMFYVVSNHDAGWADFDRDPVTDARTGLPYNLVETPAEHITVTSRRSPDFNERQHPYCGLMSSMHSWGLYNGRYGLSNMVLIDKIPPAEWIEEKHLFQNYRQLQFFDTLALYFNRTHPSQRGAQKFEHVPLNARQDVDVTVRPREPGSYEVSPYPFAADAAEFAFAGRFIEPRQHQSGNGWSSVLRKLPTQWESFRLLAA